jgi:NAD-dependent dihydropyrimidine dehydrogenase PreA subunit
MPPVFNENCTACNKCVEICPGDILREGDVKPKVVYPDECWHCGSCMMDCPFDAVEQPGTSKKKSKQRPLKRYNSQRQGIRLEDSRE